VATAVLSSSLVSQRPANAARRGGALPRAATVVGTLRLPVRETPLLVARDDSLFALVIPSRQTGSITVMRVGPGEKLMRRSLPFALSFYLMDVSAGREGVYAGTAVIKRFTNVPDMLVRIDPETLAVRARASFPGRVAALEHGRSMWASIGDGRVVRLDPRTLKVEASRRLLAPAAVEMEGLSLSKPAFAFGSLWVLTGDTRAEKLVRLDPLSLAVRSQTRLPVALARAVGSRVVGGRGRLALVGTAIVGVDAAGKLIGRPVAVSGLTAAEMRGSGWVGVTCCGPALVLLNGRGRIVARTVLRDGGGILALGGEDVWLLGDAGQGNGIVHLRLAGR